MLKVKTPKTHTHTCTHTHTFLMLYKYEILHKKYKYYAKSRVMNKAWARILNDWLDTLDFRILSSTFASSHKVFPIPKPSIAFLENVLWWKFCVLRKVHTNFGLRVSHSSMHKHNSNFSSSSYPACIYEKNRFDQNTPYIIKAWIWTKNKKIIKLLRQWDPTRIQWLHVQKYKRKRENIERDFRNYFLYIIHTVLNYVHVRVYIITLC